MNKKLVFGILAVAVAIGILFFASYEDTLSNKTINDEKKAIEPVITGGKHFSVQVNESIGLKTGP